ncbi:ABC transporter permease, partial [Streptomyces sp. NPDC056659]
MTAPAQHHAPAPHSYVSPIPVRRAHLGDALASEWTKIRSVRSTLWTLGVMVLLMVAIGLGVAAMAAHPREPGVGDESARGVGLLGVLPAAIWVVT